jgi:hypothetical protein
VSPASFTGIICSLLSDGIACSLQELLTLRKLQRPHKGIDVAKLNKGDSKKKRKAKIEEEEGEKYGLQPKKPDEHEEEE